MTINFPEAAIRYIDTRYNEDAAAMYMRMYFSACLTEQIRELMDWGEPAHGTKSGKLDGELSAITMMIVPSEPGLKHLGYSMDISEVADFSFKCENDDNGNRRRTQVDFIIRTQGLDQLVKIGTYYAAVGNGLATLTVSFHKQDTLDEDAGKRIDMAPINGRGTLFQVGPVPTPEQLAESEAKKFEAISAGCVKCDMIDDVNEQGLHTDGTVCVLAARHAAVHGTTLEEAPPVVLTAAERKKRRQEEEAQKKALREAAGAPIPEAVAPAVTEANGNTWRDNAPSIN